MVDEKTLIKRIRESHNKAQSARTELGAILNQIRDNMISGKIDIEKHVGLPKTSSIWNEIGVPLYIVGSFSDFERIFQEMLSLIKEIEKKRSGKQIHKGLALYHIGLSQINQGNFDEGIPNVLAAYEEDKRTYGESEAEKFFAYNFNKDFVENISGIVDKNFFNEMKTILASNTNLAAKSLKDLITNLDENEKLFFAKTVNSKITLKFSKDLYTRVVLWDNLRNLCLLLEIYLKRRNKATNMLGGLITLTFQGENWLNTYISHRGSKDNNDYTYYASAANLKQKLQDLLTSGFFDPNTEMDFLARVFLLSVLVRNFTAHNFDEYEQLLTDKSLYENVFKHVMFSVLYTLGL